MKKDYQKTFSYGYQYNATNSLYKEIEQIRRIQEQNQKETKIQKISNFFTRVSEFKRNSNSHIYPESEFLGI
ncbi:MAG: hypothetical protein J5I47_10835 [Vicingus serpentipes]|nr:hypothetical protein [Vicingus serpentipes]